MLSRTHAATQAQILPSDIRSDCGLFTDLSVRPQNCSCDDFPQSTIKISMCEQALAAPLYTHVHTREPQQDIRTHRAEPGSARHSIHTELLSQVFVYVSLCLRVQCPDQGPFKNQINPLCRIWRHLGVCMQTAKIECTLLSWGAKRILSSRPVDRCCGHIS